jgi:hypothetical protein
MVKFKLTPTTRLLIAAHRRKVQETVETLANAKFDRVAKLPNFCIRDGVVEVNNIKIVINRDQISTPDNAALPDHPDTPEEWAVLVALHDTVKILKTNPSMLYDS